MDIETRRFQGWFREERRERQLFDVKFYPAEVDDTDTEGFFREVNQLLELRSRFAFVTRPELY